MRGDEITKILKYNLWGPKDNETTISKIAPAMQRCIGAAEVKGADTEVMRCRVAEVQMCRYGGAELLSRE